MNKRKRKRREAEYREAVRKRRWDAKAEIRAAVYRLQGFSVELARAKAGIYSVPFGKYKF